MSELPELQGRKVLLRKPMREDIDDRILFGSPVEFIKMCGLDVKKPNEFTLDDGALWYTKISQHPCKWVIVYDGKCIGVAGLTLNKDDNKARYSIEIYDTTKYGLGIGTEVTGMALDYAFNVLKYHKVYLRVLEYNGRAIRCYEKCGFIKEGLDREGVLIDGKYETDIYMGILENEYCNFTK